ncbi:hypothetical protein TPAR_04702 [Tolypocladium paradoxum]|uniref:Uncharacterized protein n=1 Tax=Tolypocladium paradoxum TaxID=94208 RepID=A0A2S4KY34_9HYPO|nr:hypothetical protein TPAR_04702 [Tolypocladium paradoxum]
MGTPCPPTVGAVALLPSPTFAQNPRPTQTSDPSNSSLVILLCALHHLHVDCHGVVSATDRSLPQRGPSKRRRLHSRPHGQQTHRGGRRGPRRPTGLGRGPAAGGVEAAQAPAHQRATPARHDSQDDRAVGQEAPFPRRHVQRLYEGRRRSSG